MLFEVKVLINNNVFVFQKEKVKKTIAVPAFTLLYAISST